MRSVLSRGASAAARGGGAGRRGPRGIGPKCWSTSLRTVASSMSPDHDQRGVVGLVVGVVELLAVGDRDLLQVVYRPDRRPLVRVLVVGDRAEPRAPCRPGCSRCAAASPPRPPRARSRRSRGQPEVAHPLGLELHREADVRRRHGVVVAGDVLGGEGVDVAADLLEQAGVLLGRHVLGALEHHVLEHVRDAADAARSSLDPT